MGEIVIPAGYTFDKWERMSHDERMIALQSYSKHVNNYNMLHKVKLEIEYYKSIQHQIKELTK